MTDVSADINTAATVVDGRYRGQIDFAADTDWIAVELTAGVTYTFKALGSDSNNGTLEFIRIQNIFDANSSEVAFEQLEHDELRQAADSYTPTQMQASFTPSVGGTYYVDVDAWGGGPGSYTLYVTEDHKGSDASETLTGGGGNDSILGGRGDDVLEGGAGSDFLDGEWGNDQLTGGTGGDTFTFYSDDWDDINDRVANLWGNDTITDFNPAEDTIHFAGRIVRNLDDLTITELNGNTVLEAYWGDSVTLVGVSADELTDANFQFRVGVRINGGNIEGQGENDSLVGTSANDTIYGHGGDDTIRGGDGDNYLRGFEGNDLIVGGAGRDIIGGEDGNDTIRAGGGDDYILANEGDDSVLGNAGNDLIEASLGNDTLDGGSGNDTLRPGRGDDLMSGGSGNDMFVIGRAWGDDTISDFSINDDTLDFRGSGLDMDDLTITASGGNTIISSGTDSLTLLGVDRDSFLAATSDVILQAGSVTSHYSEFSRSDTIGDPTEEILAVTSVVIDDGGRWTPDEDGITRTSYSFVNYNSLVVSDDNSSWWYDAVEPVTPLTQFIVEQEIARIEGYTNLDLVWVEDYGESGANIRLGYHQFVIGGASSAPNEHPYAADVFVGIHVGEAAHALFFVHELGHSLGFDDLPDWNEFTGEDYTIMSYVKSARYQDAEHSSINAYQFMYADIAGLQYLYGIDTETTAGDETYSFDLSGDLLETLFDAGGIDTISVYGTGDAVHINLTPGTWSNIGPDIRYEWNGGNSRAFEPGTLFIMPNTTIENAVGSAGDDTITGNDAGNLLKGMDGNDTVMAGSGNDTVWAGAGDAGDDFVDAGDGDDIIGGGQGDDAIIGGTGLDIAFGGAGDDTILGGDWTDTNNNGRYDDGEVSIGDGSQNTLWAGAGNDVVLGDDGADRMGGGTGGDRLEGYGGDDVLWGGSDAGDDTLSGGAGNDTLFGAAGVDAVDGGAGADLLFNGGGSDTVDGGAGSDTLWGGGGDDRLTGGTGADIFAFTSGNGNDTITDFDTGEDRLDLSDLEIADFAAFAALASDQAGGVLVSLDGDQSILLAGLALADLTEQNLILD